MGFFPRIRWRLITGDDFARACVVFTLAFAALWWLAGHRLTIVNDEGMYLYGADRLLHGSLPFRDFFTLTGPGIYWNLGVMFKLFGVNLGAARALLAIDLALLAACTYWLTAKLHGARLGLWLAAFTLALVSADPGSLVVNHRWDSAALFTLGACLFYHGLRSGARWPFLCAGLVSAYAAWVTPPVVLVVAVMLLWLLFAKSFARCALFLAGVAGVSLAAVAGLLWTGSLGPFLTHLGWTLTQYSGANRFPYGGIVGGYPALFADAHGAELPIRAFVVFFVALPAIVPITALAGILLWPGLRRPPELFLGLCAGAAVLTCAPRMDVCHLLYAATFSWVIAAAALASVMPVRARFAVGTVLSLGAAIFAWNTVGQRLQLEQTTGRVGTLAGAHQDIALVQDLERRLAPHDRFFAFPYMPLAYFVTRTQNPTRYPFLQPGMMSDADERIALEELKEAPPSLVLYQNVPADALLRLFPSSDTARLRMPSIEAWLQEHYRPDPAFARAHPGFDLLEPRAEPPILTSRR